MLLKIWMQIHSVVFA